MPGGIKAISCVGNSHKDRTLGASSVIVTDPDLLEMIRITVSDGKSGLGNAKTRVENLDGSADVIWVCDARETWVNLEI
jgi:hypothetical protein